MSETAHEHPDDLQVPCPRCGKMTDRIQDYNVPIAVCIIFYFVWKEDRVFGCPGCVRSSMFTRLLLSIPLTNIVCWVFVPWHLVQIVSSYVSDRPGIPPEYRGLASPVLQQAPAGKGEGVSEERQPAQPDWQPSEQGQGKRMLVAVLILAVVLGVVFFVLPRLMQR
jgi:hypothetical protein